MSMILQHLAQEAGPFQHQGYPLFNGKTGEKTELELYLGSFVMAYHLKNSDHPAPPGRSAWPSPAASIIPYAHTPRKALIQR